MERGAVRNIPISNVHPELRPLPPTAQGTGHVLVFLFARLELLVVTIAFGPFSENCGFVWGRRKGHRDSKLQLAARL